MLELAPGGLFNFRVESGALIRRGGGGGGGAYLKGALTPFFKFQPQHYFFFISSEDKLALNSKSGSSLSVEVQICVRDTYLLFELLH